MAEDPAERELDINDQADVEEALQFVQSQWRGIGTQLRLRADTLDSLKKLDAAEAMGEVVKAYLKGNYDTERFGPPTWKKIVQAVEKPSGGKNAAEAKKIAETYANKVKVKSSYASSKTTASGMVSDQLPELPEPEIQSYTETNMEYFPHSEAKKIQVDDGGSKIMFERFIQYPKGDCLNEVKMSFGAVKPQEGKKNLSVAGAYDMSKWPHGICVIINNEEFSNPRHETREGTYLDEHNLVQTFRHLGYLVEVHRDRKKSEIIEIFNEIGKRDHSQYDSFVCCILSHGSAGHIFGSDSKKLPLEEITDLFKGGKCRTLATKPKLFFLQACRGRGKNKAVRVADDGNTDDVTPITADSEERVVSDSGGETIPNDADFFFSYATPMKHKAYRHMDNGSWYVSELCISLTSYGAFSSLVAMVTRTHKQVAQKYSIKDDETKEEFKQQPQLSHKLWQDVFFF